ncbi:MAG: hypothetical protein WBD20_14325 [Pirellulaceae bacterium]
MKSTSPINPYAPAAEAVAIDRLSPNVTRPAVSGGNIIWQTIGGITLSGGAFGLGTVAVIALFSLTTGGSVPGEIFVAAIMASMVGIVVAGAVSLVVAPVAYLICVTTTLNDGIWTGQKIRVFGAVTGFLAGYISLAVPSGFYWVMLLWAFLPATVGAIGTQWVLVPLARRTNDALAFEAELENEFASHDNATDDTGLAANPFASDIQ